MSTFRSWCYLSSLSVLLACQSDPGNKQPSADRWQITAPAGSAYTRIPKGQNPADTTILPNGRLLTPRGKIITVAPHPYGLTLSPDGSTVITANSGTAPLSISIIRNVLSASPQVQQVPPGEDTDKGILASVFMGLAVSPDNRTVYVGGGQENKVFLFDVATGAPKGVINCSLPAQGAAAERYTHGYIGDLVLSTDGSTIYAVDQINFQLLVLDAKTQTVVHRVPVGRYPFGVTLSPDGSKAYVANVGLYEYKILPSVDPKDVAKTGLSFPTSAYLSEEAEKGYESDSAKVPGLGKPNVPESFSVWTVDLKAAQPIVTAKVKTGFLIGEKVEGIPAVGGASPNSVVATDEYVFVSNGNNDCISVIDARENKVVENIRLTLDERLRHLRGVIPFGLALSPDRKRLYVAEAGINAVGVIDVPSRKVLGHIPVGWFPSKLAVSRDGKQLIVANAKGFGSGPNGGTSFRAMYDGSSRQSSNIGTLMKGTVSVLDIPADGELAQESARVLSNNFAFRRIDEKQTAASSDNPIPLYAKQKESPIKYFVFVAKENRTYDEIFGQVSQSKGEAALARYGADVSFASKDGMRKVENATVMPNHLALAKRFALSDNFYCDSDHSADGHRWLAGVYPNEWVETSVTASYGGNRNFRPDSKAPGNASFVGSNAAVMPEDFNEAGSIWEHFDRNQTSFFNFGFGLEMPPGIEEKSFKYGGVRTIINYPLSAPLFKNSSRAYPTFNMGIPDQYRIDVFMREYEERWGKNKQLLPSVLTLVLPNDHGSGERPADGYPFNESYMADNDLALGRLVEFLSQTPYWKNMAIIVTEDDPQGGVDHVDAHRSVLMVISPYARKNYVGSVHYSFGSVFKTMWHALGLPYLNQYDAGATDLSELFTNQPDFEPYQALPVDVRIFDPQKALDPLDEKFNWKAVEESREMDDPEDMLHDSREFDEAIRKKPAQEARRRK
jgi:YVTN family beta-propeller protein